MKKKIVHTCVECKVEIPVYQKYLCEKCFQEMLNFKLQEDDENE